MDKRIPLALVITILVQTGLAIWWASEQTNRVSNLVLQVERLDRQVDTNRNLVQTQAVQFGRIEEQISGLRNDVASLIRIIERQQQSNGVAP